ncbi:MAG: PAS domain S-box protein [Thaumarchaeota archaeon]|nr:PAS domain S-box protein [Nitrososphaerota archaeon]
MSKSGMGSKKDSTLGYDDEKKSFQNTPSWHAIDNSPMSPRMYELLEQNYQDLYEKTPCMLRSTTVDGIIFACNEFYAKKLGYQKNEVIGRSIFDHTAEKSIQKLLDEIEHWKTSENISDVEIWLKRKDGSTFPILLHGTNLFDKNKKLIGKTSVLVDMTEIYKAREMLDSNQGQIKTQLVELEKSNALLMDTERKYRDMYENSPDLLHTMNLEGIILDCNNSYCKYLGYAKKEVIGKHIFDFVAIQSIAECENSFQIWKSTGSAPNTKTWFKRKDNSEFLGLTNTINRYDITGELIGSDTTMRDITDLYEIKKTVEDNERKLKQQNEALKIAYDHLLETEQKYRTLYEESPDLLRTIDLTGNIIDCNDAYCASLGYSREEIVGKSMFVHVAERSTSDLKDAMLEWDQTGSIQNREIWLEKKTGGVFPTLLLSTNLYGINGNLIGQIGALRDMTVMHDAQKEIEEHKTKRLSAIGELSARIAHDLRNPLSVVHNTLEIIRIQNPDFEKNNQPKFDRIERAIKRMTHQIDEVMEYVVPNPLKLQQHVSLLGVVNSSVSNVVTKNTEIHVPQHDVNIECDPEKLEIVFTNLLLNATQAMNNQGSIYLRIKDCQICNDVNKSFVMIEIEDTGPGIPKILLNKIFDPLFTTRQIGTGLGLVSCKNIIEKHGGHIDIKTEIGKGATFIITIPK